MKKSGFAKGVIWTLSIGIVLVVILAAVGIVAYNGYTDAALEASYSRGDTETTIKIEKKDKITSEYDSTELAKKEVNFTEDLIKNKKKLKFKEYGPFYGIKENGIMVRGIHKGPKGEIAQTDYYGLFTKNNMYWKGYSKHSYNNGKVLYQYNEYKLDDKGNTIQDKDGIFQLVDSYIISANSFEKVKEYIHYDIELPFSFYDFEEPQTQIAKKKPEKKEKKKVAQKLKNNLITLNKCYEIDNYPKRKVEKFFDHSKAVDHKYAINEKTNTINRVWILTNQEIKSRKAKQSNVLKENVTIFEIIYIDDLIVKAKTSKKLDNVTFRNFITINLKNNTVKEDYEGKDDFSGAWSEWKCLRKINQIEIAEKETKYKTDEKYYALVIGNNNYEHLEKLDAAENDAKVLADVLKNNYGFEVKLLLNADYDTTVNSIHKISKRVTKDENLLIFYAGHGELDKKENRGYWLPVDASYEQRSKWISNAIVADKLKATDAKHVLLIVDSCFSGSLMRSASKASSNQKLDEKYIERLKKKKTRLVITSGGNEPVMDNDGGDHSLFAEKLIGTLKANKNVINTQTLFENIRQYVVNNTEQTPEKAVIYKAGHDGGDFLFFARN